MVSEYGPQGLTWDYDENKAPYLTELGLACKANKKTELTGGYSGTFQDGSNQMNAITWSIDATNPESNGATYNSTMWPSYNATLNSDIINEWRAFTGYTTQDEYLNGRPYTVAIGTTYVETPRSEELAIVWEQVTDCIKNYSWQAIYAENGEEFDAIVAEMKQKAMEYGYEECEAYCLNEAALRKAAEDEVLK